MNSKFKKNGNKIQQAVSIFYLVNSKFQKYFFPKKPNYFCMDDFSARDVCDNFQLVWTFQWSLNKKIYQPELLTVSCKYNSEKNSLIFFPEIYCSPGQKINILKNQNYFIIIYSELFKILLFSR